jgi:hypothetical protein
MPGDKPIFEALQGGQKPFFDEKEAKGRRARTHQKPSRHIISSSSKRAGRKELNSLSAEALWKARFPAESGGTKKVSYIKKGAMIGAVHVVRANRCPHKR